MQKFLLALLSILICIGTVSAQVLEDFEGGQSDLPWNGLNGKYNGVIANPDKSGINTSDFVGSYTNSKDFDFNFALANISPNTFDLAKNNMIKMKVWSPTANAKILFKFEGGGKAVEQILTLTETNKWVELSFDLSGGASFTTLNATLVSFNSFVLGDEATYYFDDIRLVENTIAYETFEVNSGITWTGLNGTFNGQVANPDPNAVNSSATVGSFTNSATADYNFAFGTFSAPLDLKKYNQFRVQLHVPKPTQVLLKLEGGGKSIEQIRNIGVVDEWQEYVFDFSGAADFPAIDKVLIVFSPGVTGAADTYFFDNLRAVPDACPGVDANPSILDDFECNRNATYSIGWERVSVIKNPDPDPVNPSLCVGRWDRPTGAGTEYAALVMDFETPIDLSVRNQFYIKVWAPKANTLLVKLEGGPSAPYEKPVQVTATNDWVEYNVDLSAQVGKGFNKLVLFFDAGKNGEVGDVYYFDDVRISQPAALPLETFQGGITLGWGPLDQNATLHGAFTAPANNPSASGVNTTTQVGCYSKGSSPFSTLQALLPAVLNLNTYGQIDMDVYGTAAAKVTLQLTSVTQGSKEVTVDYDQAGQWQTLSFDFSSFTAIADFSEIRILFNSGQAQAGSSWCIDNLRQGLVTVDPCKGVTPIPFIVDDFECQRNNKGIFYGTSDVKVVNNPYAGTVENPSTRVGQYVDPNGAGTEYAGIGYELAAPPDLTTLNQLEFQVYSPKAGVQVLIKMEGGSMAVEKFDTITEANKWVKLSADFSSGLGKDNNKIVLFFAPGDANGGGVTYFYDNLKFVRPGYNGCVTDFETPSTTIDNFIYFNQDPAITDPFTVVNNPKADNVNKSTKVGKFVQGAQAPKFTGMFADLGAFIEFRGKKQMKAKVFMDHIGTFTLKAEIFGNNPPPVEITVPNTKVNEWEELTFDFSNAPDQPAYNRLTILVDLGTEKPGTNRTTYFDDIVIGDGACGSVGLFEPFQVAALSVAPNPVTDVLRVYNSAEYTRFEVYNLFGQRVAALNNSGDSRAELMLGHLPAGVYSLNAFTAQGVPAGVAKFVKQ